MDNSPVLRPTNIVFNPFSAILEIGNGKKFSQLLPSLHCRPGDEHQWSFAISGAMSLLASKTVSDQAQAQIIRNELELLDHWADSQVIRGVGKCGRATCETKIQGCGVEK
ncbi:MAG: hypothetical protein KF752_11855 [Pirellulaceae bacterium]|nr:hypothetical protein [Pirellulaceae bacterium]